jgi:stage V sporulation protein D (sporulation-specific penicillin-binding protein)
MSKKNEMRLVLIFFLVCLCAFIITLRLVKIQLIKGKEITQKALYQRLKLEEITPERGRILDRNGKTLAVSLPTPAVYADPSLIKDPEGTAKALAPILEMKEEELVKLLKSNSQFVWLTRKISVEKRDEINNLNLRGIRIISLPRRFYPEGELAASTIGIAGIDNQGLEGIEVTYERYLAGETGVFSVEKDPAGREIPVGFKEKTLPKDGADIYLTIDSVIQHIAEREIARAVIDSKAKSGVLIAMEPKSGEILALAQYPSFNPNDFAKYSLETRKNKAITESFEPGSTFKVFVAAAAIEEGIVTPETIVYDPAYYRIGNNYIRCSNYWGHGEETFLESLERSCNPIYAKLAAEDMDKNVLYQYIRGFGFGQKTGVDFYGEATGILSSVGNISKLGLANIGFGQGIAVTPLQLVTALSAIANGGYLPKPTLVKSYKANGQTIAKETEPKKQVISTQTAETMRMMLRSVVVNGSGKRADVPGFPVGGKTGTAQVAEKGGYSSDRVVVSFLGFAPVDDPQIVALVAIYDPQTDQNLGGLIAAPVFREFTKDALQQLGIRTRVKTGGQIVVPNLVGIKRDDAIKQLTKIGLRGNIRGEGTKVSSQEPIAGSLVERNATVTLKCTSESLQETPRFIGLTLVEAKRLADARGIELKIKGEGVVATQKPEAGSMLSSGDVVEITCIAH